MKDITGLSDTTLAWFIAAGMAALGLVLDRAGRNRRSRPRPLRCPHCKQDLGPDFFSRRPGSPDDVPEHRCLAQVMPPRHTEHTPDRRPGRRRSP